MADAGQGGGDRAAVSGPRPRCPRAIKRAGDREGSMSWRRVVIAAVLGAFALSGRPAFAGKADDTLRYAVNDWWSTLDPYQFPLDEAAVFFRNVYEPLITYDERAHKFVPRLAKSWQRIDDKTFEFDLRDDVKFHNGDKFDADDVVATINYITDPKTTLR